MNARDSAKNGLVNPFQAVILADYLFKLEPIAAEEDWLLLNAALIKDVGTKQWLEELLDVLSLPQAKYDGHDIINPSVAITLSENLRGKHQPSITRQQWILTNMKLVQELGAYAWLQRLLKILATGNNQSTD